MQPQIRVDVPACEVMRSVKMGYEQCNIMERRGDVRWRKLALGNKRCYITGWQARQTDNNVNVTCQMATTIRLLSGLQHKNGLLFITYFPFLYLISCILHPLTSYMTVICNALFRRKASFMNHAQTCRHRKQRTKSTKIVQRLKNWKRDVCVEGRHEVPLRFSLSLFFNVSSVWKTV